MTAVAMHSLKTESPASAAGPSNGAVTAERYHQVVAALNDYKSTTSGVTWGSLAREIAGEYRESTLSVFAGGGYKLENARHICEAIERFLVLVDERRQLITETQFVLTSLAKRMFALIKRVVLLTKIGVIAAESGTGKTRTLQEHLIAAPRSLYIKCNSTMNARHQSVWPVLYRMLVALEIPVYGSSRLPTAAYDAIVEKLRNTSRLVIFDEAQFLPAVTLDLIRCIHEDARAPVVLAGNETLYEGSRSGYVSTAAHVQLTSRSLTEKFKTTDIKSIDVEMIAMQLVGVTLVRDASKLLVEQARMSGGFRRLVTLLQVAQTLRSGRERVSQAHVLRAIDEVREQGGAA